MSDVTEFGTEDDVSSAEIARLVDRLAHDVPGIRHALIVSADGLLSATSAEMQRADGDRLAAAAAGLVGLAHGASAPFSGGSVHQVILELENIFIFVSGIADGSALGIIAEANADVGLVGYESACLVELCSRVFTSKLCAELRESMPR